MTVHPFFSPEEKGDFEPGLLHHLPDFAFGFDSIAQKFIYANLACEDFLGWTAAQVVHRPLSDFIKEESLVPFLASLASPGAVKARLEFVYPDQRPLWGEFVGRVRSNDKSVWGICRDVTDQVRLEREMREFLSVKDQLMVVVSHDLRSAFSGILSVSEILSRDEHLNSSEESREYIDILQSSAHQTQLLMENLLHWAKAQRRGKSLRLKWMNAATLVDHLMDQFAPLARMKKLHLNAVHTRDIPIQGDEDILNVILRNLLNNAIKFTRSGGSVSLTVVPGWEGDKEFCEFVVEDTGVGIDKEILHRLTQGQESSSHGTGQEKGTGVGLRICHEFLAAHGSHLKMESEPGQGSRFSFRLPIAQIPSP